MSTVLLILSPFCNNYSAFSTYFNDITQQLLDIICNIQRGALLQFDCDCGILRQTTIVLTYCTDAERITNEFKPNKIQKGDNRIKGIKAHKDVSGDELRP